MQIAIREVTEHDLQTLREVSITTFRETFGESNTEEDMEEYIANDLNPQTLREQIEDPDSTYVLVYVDGAAAGLLKTNVGSAQTEDMGDDCLEIQRIYVLREFKGHGLGTALMTSAIDQARRLGKAKVWLGVWEHNTKAYDFYLHKGFTKVGEHVFQLGSDKQTDYIMEKSLTD